MGLVDAAEGNRVGVPERPFRDLNDYLGTVMALRPVYAVRNGKAVLLHRYDSFMQYYRCPQALGFDDQGCCVQVVPEMSDVRLHNSCYWYNARISRYYTVENRVNDQQPPDSVLCIAALTLGLVSALREQATFEKMLTLSAAHRRYREIMEIPRKSLSARIRRKILATIPEILPAVFDS